MPLLMMAQLFLLLLLLLLLLLVRRVMTLGEVNLFLLLLVRLVLAQPHWTLVTAPPLVGPFAMQTTSPPYAAPPSYC